MRVAVIGTGLIGASVGLAAKRRGHAVVGFDADPATAEVAAERGAVDSVAGSLAEAVTGAELAVRAGPVGRLAVEVPTVGEASRAGGPVTDVGATKGAKFTPDDTKLASCNGAFLCMEQAFGNLVYELGPKDAFAKFDHAIATDPEV